MPTVFRSGPYRFYFYSTDRAEPPHIHVVRDDKIAKFWLDPPRLETNDRFAGPELNRVEGLIRDNAALLLKAWHDFFADYQPAAPGDNGVVPGTDSPAPSVLLLAGSATATTQTASPATTPLALPQDTTTPLRGAAARGRTRW